MSQNNIPNTLPSIERLINRISVAEKSQQKEIRITVQEARDLANDLAVMTSKMSKTVQEIHAMLAEIQSSTSKIDVKFDGGGFN
jgi:septation ring formation regulator EzrA